ncbi:MAG: hypothetical protein WD278_13415 [Pirellulales bacterium]
MKNTSPSGAWRQSVSVPQPPRIHSVEGRHAIIAVLLLGVAGAIGSWFYYARLQRPALELWGSHNAELMLRAPLAEALLLAPRNGKAPAGSSDQVIIAGQTYRVAQRVSVGDAPGFSHIRNSLLHEASFGWTDVPGDCRPRWRHALRFTRANKTATLAFAPNCSRARLIETGAEISIQPIAEALRQFFDEQFAQPPAAG